MSSPTNDVDDEKHSTPKAKLNTLALPAVEKVLSPSDSRSNDTKLYDDLELLRAERYISNQESKLARTKSRSREPDPDDDFAPDAKAATEKPKESDAVLYRLWLHLKKFPRFIRYLLYLLPGGAILLVPVLLGYYAFEPGSRPVGGPGGVYLMWFGICLEIVWGTLWASRMITSVMPSLLKALASMFGSSNPKKWKDIGYQLELHTALFLWLLAVLVSFLPIVNSHRVPTPDEEQKEITWVKAVNKVIIALFVLASLNLAEKICIQWIATSFHQRTYAIRIEKNKQDTDTLVQLYEHSKEHAADQEGLFPGSVNGARTPMQTLQENTRHAFSKIGMVANRVGNDFIGRKGSVNHPRKVVQELLRTTASAHTLARAIYRALVRGDRETVFLEDMANIFKTPEESEAAFAAFDKDLNGDISIEEFEGVCNEIHLEKKAIAASLKDLDSVIKKLDKVFLVIIFFIAIIVFISIISGSAAAALTSAGTSILGLAWMLQATAQEFLQSIIFVFVKHPFDVGDRVTIYGNTGALGRGDDYYVTKISLLYTEFKKMEGHIVQAPNSTLNTLFILNQRRSNFLADPVQLKIRFGTTAEQIEDLKAKMLEFSAIHKRDYQQRVLTEIKTLDEMRSATMNFVFFHKSNFQNELLRLTRHNKFLAELMRQMLSLGIQGPFRNDPGGSRDFPFFLSNMALPSYEDPSPRPAPPPPPPQQTTTHAMGANGAQSPPIRNRSGSRVSTVMEDTYTDFQDVVPSRKEESDAAGLARLRSVSTKNRENGRTSLDGQGSASGLHRSEINGGRRIFGRSRAKSNAGVGMASNEDMV